MYNIYCEQQGEEKHAATSKNDQVTDVDTNKDIYFPAILIMSLVYYMVKNRSWNTFTVTIEYSLAQTFGEVWNTTNTKNHSLASL